VARKKVQGFSALVIALVIAIPAAVGSILLLTIRFGFLSLVLLLVVAANSAGTLDGRSATISLSAYWRPPLLSLLVPDGIRIAVTTTGRSVFR
jgi:hypothetical protein